MTSMLSGSRPMRDRVGADGAFLQLAIVELQNQLRHRILIQAANDPQS